MIASVANTRRHVKIVSKIALALLIVVECAVSVASQALVSVRSITSLAGIMTWITADCGAVEARRARAGSSREQHIREASQTVRGKRP